MKDQAIKLFGKEIPLLPQINEIEKKGLQDEEQIDEEIEKDLPSAESLDDSGDNPTGEDEELGAAKPSDDNNNKYNKPLKKPDKILPCPRCKSMDTKFCYYNNYNVNQPRHFCKSCQRYWTSGGTMRNVPVGAGRRKNKSVPPPPPPAAAAAVVSHYPHITISDAIQAAQMGIVHHTGFNPNGKILSFGPEPMENSNLISIDDGTTAMNPYLAGVPWPPYPLPTFYPIVPTTTPFWNCSFPNSWAIPSWLSQHPPSSRKHSREGELIKDPEPSIVIPKTLRIDDPDEAARSSIWTTLGIKNDSIKRGSLFKGFESNNKDNEKRKKNEDVESPPETSPAMMANPAALCRSVRLQEGF